MIETTDVRRGEELNQINLERFLRSELSDMTAAVSIEQFPAGSSNLTYLVRFGEDEYVLRRPPFGNTVKTAHDMRREFDVLSKLSKIYRPAPKPILFCEEASVIGSEFYLMERRRGVVIRGRLSSEQIPIAVAGSTVKRFETDRAFRTEICRSFVANLAELHSLVPESANLEGLGKPEGYNRRQVEGWTKRYFTAKTHDWPELEKAIVWLTANVPTESGASIVHNDYKFDNVMLDPLDLTKITAVLDWEMVTIGDPLMDLGTTLGYWMSSDAGDELMSMPFNPRVLMENDSRKRLAEMYADASGSELPDMLFYYVFGTFKIAVIAQQIYARYAKGFTKDQRFSRFYKFVTALGKIAAAAIERGSI